jgi:hypothetical protein
MAVPLTVATGPTAGLAAAFAAGLGSAAFFAGGLPGSGSVCASASAGAVRRARARMRRVLGFLSFLRERAR